MESHTTDEWLEQLVRESGVLANKLRLLVYLDIQVRRRTTWSQISSDIEKLVKRRVNPNALSFHLKQLLDSGLITREAGEYTVGGEPPLKRETLTKAVEYIRTLLNEKEVGEA